MISNSFQYNEGTCLFGADNKLIGLWMRRDRRHYWSENHTTKKIAQEAIIVSDERLQEMRLEIEASGEIK